ncbi:MAG: hypothetical protein QOJ00_2795 [Actinomycetota bacterium]|jgi:hypothetical protein
MASTGTDALADIPSIPGVVDLTLVGKGGSGLVYRGRQEALSRDVAVKVLAAPPATSGSVTRWERELDAMGRLSNHPNIVAVYDSGLTDDGRPYLVMPFIAGGTLGDRVRSSGPLTVDEAIPIGVKIANALTAAHEAGVLHRDVKPDNVLLSPYEPQLGDFGIARLVDATTTAVTAIGMIHATINYAAPEVLAGEPASEASDVYGLAATLYTALTGDVPFPHAPDANAVAVAHQIIHTPAPSLPGHVPAAVADVIAQGMAKDPGDRPASAAAFGAALEATLHASADEFTVPVEEVAEPTRTDATVRAAAIPTIAERLPPPRATGAVERRRGPARDRRPVIFAVAAIALIGAVLLFTRLSDHNARTGVNASASSTTAVSSAAAKTATTARTTRTTKPAKASKAASSGAVADTARQYFTRLSGGDYGGAYAMLSPGFKAAQSQASFETFWRSASPVSITGDVTANGLTAQVPIRMGSRPNTYTLTMARGTGGTLYVDGPRPR